MSSLFRIKNFRAGTNVRTTEHLSSTVKVHQQTVSVLYKYAVMHLIGTDGFLADYYHIQVLVPC